MNTDITIRLLDDAAIGLDLSPGNPLSLEAAKEIERLRRVNAQLLAACEKAHSFISPQWIGGQKVKDLVLAAIKAAK